MDPTEESAQDFAEQLLQVETSARQELLEVFLDNLDGETRGMLAEMFQV